MLVKGEGSHGPGFGAPGCISGTRALAGKRAKHSLILLLEPASQPWGMEIWCQCFAVRVINRWNDFPRAVVDSSSLQFFKSGSAVKIIWGQFLACVRQEVTVVPPGLGIAQSVEADMLPELSPGTDPDMTAYSWLGGGGGSSVACRLGHSLCTWIDREI